MQLIFLSTMERNVAEGRAETAQVSITEHQGAWRVLWNGAGPDGRPEQSTWYEGIVWKDMLQAYREGLRVKRSEGFFPLVDAPASSTEAGKGRDLLMLQYYGEKHHSEELFEELRKWRRQTASKEGKSAYYVATNRMLYMVAAFLPRTEEELKLIPGFGERKAVSYGKDLLEITGKEQRCAGFPLDWVYAEVDEADFGSWVQEQQRTREQLEQQRDFQRRKVLEGAAAGLSLAELEIAAGIRRRELVRLIEELDRGGYDMEPVLNVELAELGDSRLEASMELFAKHGTRFLKPVLLSLYTEEELKERDLNAIYEKLKLQRIRYNRELGAADSAAASEQAAV